MGTHRSKKRNPEKKTPAIGASIILTGRRRDEHFAVFVDGDLHWLPCASFIALTDLVHAASQAEAGGYAHVSRSTIHRLRTALGARATWIEHGSGKEYRLAVPKPKTGKRFAVTPCFAHLPDLAVLSKDRVEYLRKNCHPCAMPEIEK